MASPTPRPIFPPEEPNYSLEALEASRAHLDADMLALLDVDRARLTQGTTVATLAIGESLGLSTETIAELVTGLNERLAQMSPAYHKYIGQLLANAAIALGEQQGVTENVPHLEVATPTSPRLAEQSATDSTDEAEVEAEAAQVIVAPEEVLTYDPEDILNLPEDLELVEHQKPVKGLLKFAKEVFPDYVEEINAMSPLALSLLGWRLIDTYMVNKIHQASDARKATQKERMELLFGFNGKDQKIFAICGQLGISNASFYTGLQRVKESLSGILAEQKDDFIRQTVVTAEFGNLKTISAEEVANNIETVADMEAAADEVVEAAQPQLQELHIHYRGTPPNMRNFLINAYPPEYGDRIHSLNPYQAGRLVQALIERYRNFTNTGLNENDHNERVTEMEQWAGLYGEAKEPVEIGMQRNLNPAQVKTHLDSAIAKIGRNLSISELRELLDATETLTDNRRVAGSTS